MGLKDFKLELPAGWKEASRMGNENQVNIQLYHISPLAHIDPKIMQEQLLSSTPTSSVSKMPVNIPTGQGTSGDTFKWMQALKESGYAPSYMTDAWIKDLKDKMTKTPGAERPDESDLSSNISIMKYQTAEMAEQAFKNYGALQTTGFGMPVMGIPMPGGKSMTFADLLQSDVLKSQATPEQLEKMKEMVTVMKEQAPKLQADLKKTGLVYKEEDYLGFKAIVSEMPNPQPKPQPKPFNTSPKKFVGGGSRGNNTITPMPKIVKPYSPIIRMYQAILVKNYVVTGGLISSASMLPDGNTPCHSLTKKLQRYETVEGIKTTIIIPAASNYAQEGYLHKENVEEVLKSVFTAVAAL